MQCAQWHQTVLLAAVCKCTAAVVPSETATLQAAADLLVHPIWLTVVHDCAQQWSEVT